ncbi:hypothetical protein HYFRA_00008513 [Hymenoscyphus fraxineus]|uniref:Uncharacterized protein n=1 Tax=Hymenoscyphus fraxineus TaxID=746836 RepID=A0A9N9KXY1_9HELO|nr:hypothetical protein HYFRA_00008513 [Hymenoscyphus fraxineus]
MTYPPREPRGTTAKRRVKQGEPFDPEDLCRRLEIHLAEQRFKAEKRREARAAKAAAAEANGIYHHIPKVAATAFQRTATPDVLRQVHKLAEPVLKTQLSIHNEEPGLSALKKTQARDQVAIEKECVRTRNQFQWTHDMEEAVVLDIDRDLYKPPQRTFQPETSHLRILRNSNVIQRFSTSDMLSDDEQLVHGAAKPRSKPLFEANDRHDWAQRDDAENGHTKREWVTPFLRKKDSSWMMMVRGEKNIGHKNGVLTNIGNLGSPTDASKGGKGRFLARFKRHPS